MSKRDNNIDSDLRKKSSSDSRDEKAQQLSEVLQKEIRREIKLRISDLETVEENIYLCKKYLLKLRQAVTTECYKQKHSKDNALQYPHHPAVQDTFTGKRPRGVTQSTHPTDVGSKEVENPRKKKKLKTINVDNNDIQKEERNDDTSSRKPPCYIPPNPCPVVPAKPPEPRGYESQRELRIIVGNVSKWLSPDEGDRATHKWTVFTKTSDPEINLAAVISKVVFYLDSSYKPNDVVSVTSYPFKLTRRGWGEFPIKARFHFKNPLNSPVDVVHELKLDKKHTGLETYGSETSVAVWVHIKDSPEERNNPQSSSYEGEHESIQEDGKIEWSGQDVVQSSNVTDDYSLPEDEFNLVEEEVIYDFDIIHENEPVINIKTEKNSTANADECFAQLSDLVGDGIINSQHQSTTTVQQEPEEECITSHTGQDSLEVINIKQEPEDLVEESDPYFTEQTSFNINDESVTYPIGPHDIKSEPIDHEQNPFECLNVESSVEVVGEYVSSNDDTSIEDIPHLSNRSPNEDIVSSKDNLIHKQTASASSCYISSQTISSEAKQMSTPSLTVIKNQNITVSQEPKKKSEFIRIDSTSPNFKISKNTVILQSGNINKHLENSSLLQLPAQNKQLNTIELTENGKTLVTRLVPVELSYTGSISGSLNSASNISKKVVYRKLNGDVATIVTSVNPDIISNSLKVHNLSPVKGVINTIETSANILKRNQPSSVSKMVKILTPANNLKSLLNSGSKVKIALPSSSKNIVVEKNSPRTISIPQASVTSPLIKANIKHDLNTSMKSGIIMLQTETGQVILQKEAKFSTKLDHSPVNLKPHEKVLKLASVVKKKDNGKEINEPDCSSILPNSVSNESNITPLIKSQLQMDSNDTTHDGKILFSKPKVPTKKSLSAVKKKSTTLLKSNISTEQMNSPKYRTSDISRECDLLKCPTHTSEAAVSWLMKRHPLIDSKAQFDGFRREHPYCARSKEEFFSWHFAKQKANELFRARAVTKKLSQLKGITEKWSVLQVYDWARTRCYTPLKSDPEECTASTSRDKDSSEDPKNDKNVYVQKYFYQQPTAEILQFVKACQEIREQEIVDVCGIEEKPKGPKPFVSSKDKQFKYNVPPEKDNCLFEPELVGLMKHVHQCQQRLGIATSPEMLAPGILYPAADRMLISAFHSLGDDLIRRAHSASYIRNNDKAPCEISLDDVWQGIVSRPEFDLFLPSKVGKRERPPVSVLRNFR